MKAMLNKILQKQDYNTVCLNDSVKTLAENDQTIAQSLDRLSIQTDKKIHEAAIAHGKEFVKVNKSLDIVKHQVWVVSTLVESLKKKPSAEVYKSATLFSEPITSVPYSITPSMESLIKAPSAINFPPPTSTHPYSLFANPSVFSKIPYSAEEPIEEKIEEFKGSVSEFFFGDSSHGISCLLD